MSLFRQQYVVDTNGQPVQGVSGRVYDLSDESFSAPLDVTDAAGVPITLITISDAGVNPAFIVDDRMQVRWRSEDGSIEVIFDSLDAMLETATVAREASESAVQQLGQFVDRVGVPGGIAGLNVEGDVLDANGRVVGNDTRRPNSVIWAYGADSPRPTASREVMVIWITDGTEPVNGLAGVDVWLNRLGGLL